MPHSLAFSNNISILSRIIFKFTVDLHVKLTKILKIDLQGEYANCGSPISTRISFFLSGQYLSRGIRVKLSAIFEKNRFKVYKVIFVRTFKKRVVAQGLKCLTTTQETRVRFPLVTFF